MRSITLASGLIVFMLSGFVMGETTLAFKDDSGANSTLTKVSKPEGLQEHDIARFTNAINQIKDFYVQPISDKKLLEDAIRGMLSGLDPHSEYLDEDAYKTLLMTTTGAFGGLGIEVTGEYGVLKVISPIDDTPASKAGIKPGDYIVGINNKLVNEMSLSEAVDNMRGKKGTPVSITIIRKGEPAPKTYKLIREEIQIASVKGRMLDNGFAYIRLSEFQKPTTALMTNTIESLKKSNQGKLKGLVLDLRNNPGGLLDTAVQVANAFLDSKNLKNQYNNLIVYTDGRLSNTQFSAKATAKASPGDIINDAPMVVLINEGSASASEIVAGALQDYHRAVIVGVRSFGKGSVQTVLPLDETHAIKLTTALYHTPSGRLIQNKGITPDISVDDLKIAGNKIDTTMMAPIREYELKGHLANKTVNNDALSKSENVDTINLARTDFQLYQALKVLNTMYMLDQDTLMTVAKPIANSPNAVNAASKIPITTDSAK
jgi:carboxyl-terminal processing protease